MTQNNRESKQRAVGIIEGVSFVVSEQAEDALAVAIEILVSVLDKEEE